MKSEFDTFIFLLTRFLWEERFRTIISEAIELRFSGFDCPWEQIERS